MSQLINRGINTIPFTNAVLRNLADLGDTNYILLRSSNYNMPEFAKLNIFKPLVLDLARQFDAGQINDIAIIITKPGQDVKLDAEKNRIILILENEASFTNNENRYTPAPGDLIWTNEEITINNTAMSISYILVIDLEEFVL